MQNISLKKELKDYIYILIGGTLLAVGVTLFYIPSQIVAGGTPGIAILINQLIGYPIGILMFCMNAVLLLFGIKYIGKNFAVKTIFSIFVSSFMVDLINEYLKIEPFTYNPLLASVFGGIIIGFGLGFIIEGNSSAGGPSIIAKIISVKTKYKQQNIITSFDIIIVVSAGFVYQNIESTLWSLIGVYCVSKGMDVFISGGQIYKSVHISSKNIQQISENVYSVFGKEGILVEGESINLDEKKRVLMVVIPADRMIELQEIINKYDDKSLVVAHDASELIGSIHNS